MVFGMVVQKDAYLVAEMVVMKEAVKVDKTAARMDLNTVAPMDIWLELESAASSAWYWVGRLVLQKENALVVVMVHYLVGLMDFQLA